jgi:hypothetical protein
VVSSLSHGISSTRAGTRCVIERPAAGRRHLGVKIEAHALCYAGDERLDAMLGTNVSTAAAAGPLPELGVLNIVKASLRVRQGHARDAA